MVVSALLAGGILWRWGHLLEPPPDEPTETELIDFRTPLDIEPGVQRVETFADFDPQTRDQAVSEHGLSLQLFLLSPAALGVREWSVGDGARYRFRLLPSEDPEANPLRRRPPESEVSVRVVERAGPEDILVQRFKVPADAAWLEFHGLETYRGKPKFNYLLTRPDDLRPCLSTPLYSFQTGYFPQLEFVYDLSGCQQAELEFLRRESCETPAGTFDCDVYRGRLAGTPMELWASSQVAPLGIVRLRTDEEELLLLEHGHRSEPAAVDPQIEDLVGGVSSYAFGCLGCHPKLSDCHTTRLPAR